MPNIRARYPTDLRFCRNLGLALLYICMDEDLCKKFAVPQTMSHRVHAAYITSQQTEEGNPVEKIPLTIYRVNENLMIDDTVGGDSGGGGGGGGGLPQAPQQTFCTSLHPCK